MKGNRGRPKIVSDGIELSPEDNRTRFLLLRRRAAFAQRIRALEDKEVSKDDPKFERLNANIMRLHGEIERVGGVPKSWLVA